ncbi:hypothetical protein PsYK624_058690 [Phanerochaete sordida]|uniref:Uncharacterized protein n=1 Tax=Phanerochaete sordida TaxID=48140 RepID=A0A9P3G810_9APHY|nr:hypothetical protein PsYK624_058690 [Phanerochaete sordida]
MMLWHLLSWSLWTGRVLQEGLAALVDVEMPAVGFGARAYGGLALSGSWLKHDWRVAHMSLVRLGKCELNRPCRPGPHATRRSRAAQTTTYRRARSPAKIDVSQNQGISPLARVHSRDEGRSIAQLFAARRVPPRPDSGPAAQLPRAHGACRRGRCRCPAPGVSGLTTYCLDRSMYGHARIYVPARYRYRPSCGIPISVAFRRYEGDAHGHGRGGLGSGHGAL